MSRGTAVITGASSGIGSVFARRLAQHGYDLLLIARRKDRLDELAAQLSKEFGGDASTLTADLATDEGIAAAGHAIASAPNLTMLVNNAGFGIAGRFFQTPVEQHDRMHRLHVLATLHLTHAALQRMVPANAGSIINVSSVAGFTISPGSVSYSATKHWINVFTEGVWLDLKTRRSSVRVQALCPGFTYSEFHDVMPMDRRVIGRSWWCSADDVVNESLRGLEANKLFVIPGWRYRALIGLVRMTPGALLRGVSARFARRLGRGR